MAFTHLLTRPQCSIMRYSIRGYYGNYNLGDELMLQAIVQDLKNITPNCEIEVYGIDYETAETLSIQPVSSYRKSIAKSNLLIIGGGNLLYDRNSYGHNSLWSCLKEVIFARLNSTKVLFYGVGVGPIVTPIGRKLLRLLIYLSEGITVRDPDSYSLLIDCGVSRNKIALGTDLVFKMSFNEPPTTTVEFLIHEWLSANRKLKVIVNVFNMQRELLPRFLKKQGELRRQLISKLLDRIVEDYNAQIIFVSAQGQVAGCDHLEAQRIISLMKGKEACINIPYLNPKWMPYIIKHADVVIAMRLHISILAFKLGVIPVGLSYSLKVKSFYKMIGIEENCFHADAFDVDELYNIVTKFLRDKDRFEQKCQDVNIKLSESANVHVQTLERVIHSIC